MNADLANLLGALRDSPDDDLGRLALADWCQEQPDTATRARGDHVRLALELSKLKRGEAGEPELRARVKALEGRWRSTWLGPLRHLMHRCDFLPGGLVKAEATGNRAAQARKEGVRPPTDEEFAWVSSLVVRATQQDELNWLARTLPAGLVRSFELQIQTRTDDCVASVSSCRWLTGLRALRLYWVGGPRIWAGAGRLADLPLRGCVLTLHNAGLGVRGCSALAAGGLSALAGLTLNSCRLAGGPLRALLVAGFEPPPALSFAANDLTTADTDALAAWPGLAHVRELILDYNPIGDAGALALARSPHLTGIRKLSLLHTGVTARGLRAFSTIGLVEA